MQQKNIMEGNRYSNAIFIFFINNGSTHPNLGTHINCFYKLLSVTNRKLLVSYEN